MKRNHVVILTIAMLITSCKSLEGSKYYLSKKYPSNVQIEELFFKDDSTAILTFRDKSVEIGYFKPNRDYLIINKVEDDNIDLPFQKGDSITIFKKELYYFKDKYKLVFEKS